MLIFPILYPLLQFHHLIFLPIRYLVWLTQYVYDLKNQPYRCCSGGQGEEREREGEGKGEREKGRGRGNIHVSGWN